jgi:hypothetical protein
LLITCTLLIPRSKQPSLVSQCTTHGRTCTCGRLRPAYCPSPRPPSGSPPCRARSFLGSSHAYMLVGMMMPSSPDWSDAFHGTQLAALIPFWLWAHSAALSFLVELVIPDESSRVCTARRPELAPFVSSFQPVASNFGRQPHFFSSFQLVAPNVARPPRPPRHPLR